MIAFFLQRFGTIGVFAFIASAMFVVVLAVAFWHAHPRAGSGGDCAIAL